jgi:hypothetical protein
MPRPLLEIWRKLNLGRDREPSSLLQQAIAEVERELSSPAALKKRMLVRAISRRALSLAEQVVVDMARQERRLREENGVAERVLGTPRPIAPAQPHQRKRKPSHPTSLTPVQIEKAADILRDRPGMSLTDVWKTLDAEGIRASKSTIYRLVFKPARGRP